MRRLLLVLLLSAVVAGQDNELFRTEADVVYGRKHGMALTMDVFTPRKERRRSAILFVVSGGWFSSKRAVLPHWFGPLLREGHTVFAVLHGSAPRYTIPEIVPDIHRAVRFVRHGAARFGIDPDRIGICGASAGGHLSLLIATSGAAGKEDAIDPVERVSSRVQAVAAFFPPTDFLNWGEARRNVFETEIPLRFRAPFDFHRFEISRNAYVPVTEEKERDEILRQISPITHVSRDDPPTLLIHGNRDRLVPLQQSEVMFAALERAGVDATLEVKEDAGHGWRTMAEELKRVAAWFRGKLTAER